METAVLSESYSEKGYVKESVEKEAPVDGFLRKLNLKVLRVCY